MSKKDDGGPAFPRDMGVVSTPGMSLRDWFAGQVLAGFMANTKRPTTYHFDDADWAYAVADAMLEARKK